MCLTSLCRILLVCLFHLVHLSFQSQPLSVQMCSPDLPIHVQIYEEPKTSCPLGTGFTSLAALSQVNSDTPPAAPAPPASQVKNPSSEFIIPSLDDIPIQSPLKRPLASPVKRSLVSASSSSSLLHFSSPLKRKEAFEDPSPSKRIKTPKKVTT